MCWLVSACVWLCAICQSCLNASQFQVTRWDTFARTSISLLDMHSNTLIVGYTDFVWWWMTLLWNTVLLIIPLVAMSGCSVVVRIHSLFIQYDCCVCQRTSILIPTIDCSWTFPYTDHWPPECKHSVWTFFHFATFASIPIYVVIRGSRLNMMSLSQPLCTAGASEMICPIWADLLNIKFRVDCSCTFHRRTFDVGLCGGWWKLWRGVSGHIPAAVDFQGRVWWVWRNHCAPQVLLNKCCWHVFPCMFLLIQKSACCEMCFSFCVLKSCSCQR